ncbi:MAG: hypothetical protein QME58_01735 [Bacteroidota bacterium]|nr:hypothetical protein [Bacteroidota bacterium]
MGMLEKKEFTDSIDDEFEFDGYVDSRAQILANWNSYDEATKIMIEDLDERFKKALFPALRGANLLDIYLEYDSSQPPEEWWWHLE